MLHIIENLLFFGCILSSIFILFSSNPIQSLLNLVLTFAISSILFMIIGVEFLSLLIFIVYIGAIAVLFLFVIMMLNIKIVELRTFYLRYVSIGFFIILFFFF
jgi:NADH-quinone oxidoreductase subunit J